MSFQDRLNDNTSTFNALRSSLSDNPQALQTIAGSKYNADNSVRGDEFRTNQAEYTGITNDNIKTLNDAQLKNLGILDNQYVRQTQAGANTKAVTQGAITSIADKVLENNLNNRKLMAYESMTGARFIDTNNDGREDQLQRLSTGDPFYYPDNVAGYTPIPHPTQKGAAQAYTIDETTQKLDKYGRPVGSQTKSRTRTPKGENGVSLQSMMNKKFGRLRK